MHGDFNFEYEKDPDNVPGVREGDLEDVQGDPTELLDEIPETEPIDPEALHTSSWRGRFDPPNDAGRTVPTKPGSDIESDTKKVGSEGESGTFSAVAETIKIESRGDGGGGGGVFGVPLPFSESNLGLPIPDIESGIKRLLILAVLALAVLIGVDQIGN